MSLARPSDRVLLLHGLGGSSWWMRSLARRLAEAGFESCHFQYPSLTGRICDHARSLTRFLEDLDAPCDDQTAACTDVSASSDSPTSSGSSASGPRRLHVVAHSLGNLVLRRALAESCPDHLGRVVMLTPPNHGSHVATQVAPYLGWLCSLLHELKEQPEHDTFDLPLPPRVEVGVIASPADAVVRVESTLLPGLADHTLVPCRHVGVLFDRGTAEQVTHFLRHGRFQVESDACAVPPISRGSQSVTPTAA